MKFKVGDEVRVVVDCCFTTIKGLSGTIRHITTSKYPYKVVVDGSATIWNLAEQDLELVCVLAENPEYYGQLKSEQEKPECTFVGHPDGGLEVKDTPIRTFDTGATRDTVQGKLSYVRILSPIVLRRYVEYMNFHAKQSDGTMREPDNWKSGFPIETYLDSLGRHLVAVWLLQQDFTETDNHGSVTLEDSLCGIIFNAMGWLHEILKTKLPPNKAELGYQAAVEHETGVVETVPGYGGDV